MTGPTPPSETAGRTAIDELTALLAACSADPNATAANEQAFLRKMDLGDLRSIADVRPVDFPRLKNALLKKKAVLAQRGTMARHRADERGNQDKTGTMPGVVPSRTAAV